MKLDSSLRVSHKQLDNDTKIKNLRIFKTEIAKRYITNNKCKKM